MNSVDYLQTEYLKAFEQIKPYLDDMRDNWHLYRNSLIFVYQDNAVGMEKKTFVWLPIKYIL